MSRESGFRDVRSVLGLSSPLDSESQRTIALQVQQFTTSSLRPLRGWVSVVKRIIVVYTMQRGVTGVNTLLPQLASQPDGCNPSVSGGDSQR